MLPYNIFCYSFVGHFTEAESHAFHHFVPRAGMVGHGVEEHSIHIEEHSLEIDSLMAVLLQVVIDCFYARRDSGDLPPRHHRPRSRNTR